METIDLPAEKTIPRKRRPTLLLGFFVLCVLAVGYGVYWVRYCPISAIEAKDIASMQLTIYGRIVSKEETIRLKPQAFSEVLTVLKPCRCDWSGIQWTPIGVLEIRLNNGAQYKLNLFETLHEEVAFSIDGRHYFGGSEKRMNELLVRESLRDAVQKIGILKRLTD